MAMIVHFLMLVMLIMLIMRIKSESEDQYQMDGCLVPLMSVLVTM